MNNLCLGPWKLNFYECSVTVSLSCSALLNVQQRARACQNCKPTSVLRIPCWGGENRKLTLDRRLGVLAVLPAGSAGAD